MDEQTLKAWRTNLRGELIARRIAAAPAHHAKWSATIESELERLLRDVAGKIVSFCWPYQAEFDTRPLILRLLAQGARTALPIVVKPRQPMIFREWTPQTKMVAGVYDIPVPIDSAEVVPDVALIPLAGFDEQGYRLGYGGGFFDRTLAALAPRPLAVGVGFELARVPTIYPQPYDVPLDYVVTELGLQRRVEERLVLAPTSTRSAPCT